MQMQIDSLKIIPQVDENSEMIDALQRQIDSLKALQTKS